jgi:hypothetical protein
LAHHLTVNALYSASGRGKLSNTFIIFQEREKKKLDLELEARLAAEEKARKYEASAEVLHFLPYV